MPPFLLIFKGNLLRFLCIPSLWPSWHETYSRLRNDASSSLVSSKLSAFVIYLTLTTRIRSATPQPCADTDTVPSKSRRPSGHDRYNLASNWVGRRKRWSISHPETKPLPQPLIWGVPNYYWHVRFCLLDQISASNATRAAGRPKFLLVLLTILVFIACFAPTANAKAGFNVSVGILPTSMLREARQRELLKMREHVTQLRSRVQDIRLSLRLSIEKMESCREILAVNVEESVWRDTKVARDNLKEFMKCVEDLIPF